MTQRAAVSKFAKDSLSIFVSLSKNIFENLAFEEWLLRNYDFASRGKVLLMWRNSPAVVIGRHQNPWLEANIGFLNRNVISLSRRHSGGGAVYHDLGNLNISILTEQNKHNRKENLIFLSNIIKENFKIDINPNARDDLYLSPGNRKVSGTAARIIHGRAYHHLTLLVHIDVNTMKQSLISPLKDCITTNATRSVRAPAVGCLSQEKSDINVHQVADAIIEAYKRIYKIINVEKIDVIDEIRYPGVAEYEKELRTWDWIFGKSPKFTLSSEKMSYYVERGVIMRVDGEKSDLIGEPLPCDIYL